MTDSKPEFPADPPVDAHAPNQAARTASSQASAHKESDHLFGAPEQLAGSHSSYQNYLFRSAGVQTRPAWSDSAGGRAVIRLVSRGLVGAAAFTIGGRVARTQMMDYDPLTVDWATIKEKPLQGIAKVFDEVLGRPIAWVARNTVNTTGLTQAEALVAKENAAWNAVNFRTKGYYHSTQGLVDAAGRPMNGRSLGAEMVSITFDFAMASVGDASTRNFVQMIDPNVRKSWMLNDHGQMAAENEKAHFSLPKFLQSTGVAAWRVISKNQGEDWVAALPYVYQMKAQRGLLTHLYRSDLKGSKLVFDNQWNGGAYKVNNEGKIIGDYQLAGAVDLHARFVGYNVYTLMFREGYDWLGEHISNWRKNGYRMSFELPEHFNPIDAAYQGVRETGRYILKSVIKANLYMNPAVVPFWLMRVPQTKWRGGMINPQAGLNESAIASVHSFDDRVNTALHEQGLGAGEFNNLKARMNDPQEPGIFNYSTSYGRVQPGWTGNAQPEYMYFGNQVVANPMHGMNGPHDSRLYDHYEPGFSKGFSKMLNPFGRLSYWLGGKATRLANQLPEGRIKNFIGLDEATMVGPHAQPRSTASGRETFMRSMVDASLSYTPYMYAKGEFGLMVDDRAGDTVAGKMDNTIYSFIDNVAAFHPGAALRDVKQMWKLSIHHNDTASKTPTPTFTAPTTTAAPQTTVQPEGRQHTPMQAASAVATNPDAASTDHQERSWAESVVGHDLAAQFQPTPSATRH